MVYESDYKGTLFFAHTQARTTNNIKNREIPKNLSAFIAFAYSPYSLIAYRRSRPISYFTCAPIALYALPSRMITS